MNEPPFSVTAKVALLTAFATHDPSASSGDAATDALLTLPSGETVTLIFTWPFTPLFSPHAITSGIELRDGPAPAGAFALADVPGVAVVPRPASGEKCQRCWQVLPEVSAASGHLCRRCGDAVAALEAA